MGKNPVEQTDQFQLCLRQGYITGVRKTDVRACECFAPNILSLFFEVQTIELKGHVSVR